MLTIQVAGGEKRYSGKGPAELPAVDANTCVPVKPLGSSLTNETIGLRVLELRKFPALQSAGLIAVENLSGSVFPGGELGLVVTGL